jgi:hypothetical protein
MTDEELRALFEASAAVTQRVIAESAAGLQRAIQESASGTRQYVDEKFIEARAHTDEKFIEARAHTDEKSTEARAHTDEKFAEARRYADEKFSQVRRHAEIVAEHQDHKIGLLGEQMGTYDKKLGVLRAEVKQQFEDQTELIKFGHKLLDQRISVLESKT